MNKALVLLLLLCISSVLLVAGLVQAKKSGMISGTEEFYIKMYELDKLRTILIDAVAADAQIFPPEKTLSDFAGDVDQFVEYKIELAEKKKQRDEIALRSKPHIENIKMWCAKNHDNVEKFKKSDTIKIIYLNGSQVSAATFYKIFMSSISDDGKKLLKDICEK
jgi:hypothetical protein